MELISIIILNWNNKAIICDCLKGVFSQSYENLEIIFIDNASIDGSLQLVKKNFPKIDLIIENKINAGFSKALNNGIKKAKGEFILSLNSDVILTSNYIQELRDILSSSERVGWVTGKLLRSKNNEESKIIDSAGHFMLTNWQVYNRGAGEIDAGQYDGRGYVFGACAAAALYKKEMLENIKLQDEYFDEDFFAYFEDADLDWRAQLYGWKCVYVPNALAYHQRGGSQGELVAQIYGHYLKNRYLMAIKNDSIIRVLKKGFFIISIELYNIFFKKNQPLLLHLKNFKRVVSLMPKFIKKRRIIQSRCCVSSGYIKKWFLSFFLFKNKKVLRDKTHFPVVRRYNVLYVISCSALAGMEKELLSLVESSDINKFSNSVICCRQGPLVEKLKSEGHQVQVIAGLDSLNILKSLQFLQILRKEKINLVCVMGNRIPAIAAKFYGAKVVQRRNQPSGRIRKLGRIPVINSFLDFFVDRIIAVSSFIKEDIVKNEGIDGLKIKIIFNGVNINKYNKNYNKSNILKSLGLSCKKPIVAMIARLEEQKGHVYFLQAAKSICAVNSEVQFLIVGEGSLRNDLEEKTAELDLLENVYFCGFRDDVDAILPAVDVFVMASLWEGFPFSLLEVLAASRPIVTTDAGGVGEIIQNNVTGLVVPCGNSKAIAQAVLTLIKDEKLRNRLTQAGYKKVSDNFTIEKMVKRTEKLYEKVLQYGKN